MNRRLRCWLIKIHALACLSTILVVNSGQAQDDPLFRLNGARALMLQNVGFYLDGAVEVDVSEGEVHWETSEKDVLKQVVRIIEQVGELQGVRSLAKEVKLSEEVVRLVHEVNTLTVRDLRHWRMAEGLSEAEQWYVMVQTVVDELKMQIAVDLKVHLNEALFRGLEQSVIASDQDSVDWLNFDPNDPLPPTDWEVSDATLAALSVSDQSDLFPTSISANGITNDWMERIVRLLELQESRLQALERQWDLPSSNPQGSSFLPVYSDPSLQNLRLPEFVDVTFYSGSSKLGLSSQLQLNEIIALMVRYPQLRVVCTGHADSDGDRANNMTLSRRRAEAVREYLLQSGVLSQRVLLNYFGEEQSRQAGAADRRVEVRFFVN
ncbi:MAG: OmpA family protein [Flavobacteriales bacterium]